jgi:outer membrane protein OmpA-like peptidoglycan-associated protein
LTQEALEAAGPIVSSRYGVAGAPTGSADPEDPVEVNLDALRGLGPLGPGATLAPAQAAPNSAAYANQGGPGNIPPYVVSFAHGSTGLNAEDRQKIAAAAASAAAYNGIVRVVGHASSRTGDLGVGDHLLANFNVSMKRANAVANELIRAGVDPSRVVVEAKGDAVPVYYESMPAGEAGNRRAEIFIE